jgi:hypothetical protein
MTATSQALTAKAGRGGWTEVRRSPGNEANGGDAGCVRKLSSSWVPENEGVRELGTMAHRSHGRRPHARRY